MDTRKFTLLISALTMIVCVMTVIYNFASMPAYGNAAAVSAVPLYAQQGAYEVLKDSSYSAAGEEPTKAESSAKARPGPAVSKPAKSGKTSEESGNHSVSAAKNSAPALSGRAKPAAKAASKSARPSSAKATVEHPVNLNTATLEELDSVPYIGKARAQAIINYRSSHGPFSSVDELDNVKGFGKKMIAKVRPYLTVD